MQKRRETVGKHGEQKKLTTTTTSDDFMGEVRRKRSGNCCM